MSTKKKSFGIKFHDAQLHMMKKIYSTLISFTVDCAHDRRFNVCKEFCRRSIRWNLSSPLTAFCNCFRFLFFNFCYLLSILTLKWEFMLHRDIWSCRTEIRCWKISHYRHWKWTQLFSIIYSQNSQISWLFFLWDGHERFFLIFLLSHTEFLFLIFQ